jgi:hypothetical protein
MASRTAIPFKTPKGEFTFVIINGEGHANQKGKLQYKASVVLDPADPKCIAFKKLIDDFWAENKPKGAKKPNTCGYRPHTVKSTECDEDGDPIYEETGKLEFYSSTGTTWPDGSKKVIRVYNSKAKEVDLGTKKVGNGSVGYIAGNLDVYDVAGNQGVNLYLDAIQITKFVEYVAGPNFNVDDDEDGWDGEDVNEFTGDEEETETPKPRI